jgi:hypothetical protein
MDERAYSTLLKYVENTEYTYTKNLTKSEKRKIRKQAKHYVSMDNLLYYVNAKGETRRVVRETEKYGTTRHYIMKSQLTSRTCDFTLQ